MMNQNLMAAILAAVQAYLRDEEAMAEAGKGRPRYEMSAWKLFGRGEVVRGRTHWQASRARK